MRLRSGLRYLAFRALAALPANHKFTSARLTGHLIHKFVNGPAGQAYGIGRAEKYELISAFQRINQNVLSATAWPAYIILAEHLLNVAPQTTGSVIECGCYKGASTSALSLVCELAGRKLIVCDSFQGLPDEPANTVHSYPHLRKTTTYRKGDFAGRLDEVRDNIRKFGALAACEFRPGYFSSSLAEFKDPLVFGFFDVDLRSSMEDCIRHLWPCFRDGSYLFTDDSCDMEVVKFWFDNGFWTTLGCPAPGYVGSGCGIPSISPDFSSLGYTIKNPSGFTAFDFSPRE